MHHSETLEKAMEAACLYLMGYDPAEIAQKLKCSRNRVYSYFKALDFLTPEHKSYHFFAKALKAEDVV